MSTMCSKEKRTAIIPRRDQNYAEWYQQVIKAADLAENSVVRGCMVMKPWGYLLWENIQKTFDKKIKQIGYNNAYFPLFIPLRFFEKEAEHVDGFAKECAIVTHSKLQVDENGNLIPISKLEEPLIVRPTSEVIIGESFSKWVQSYRDLPLKINQWANVVRWEMRTRMFLRTSEFLWQEGHSVHESAKQAIEETLKTLEVYRWFVEEYMAIPVICGKKSENEKFPGAVDTYSIEAMMQDKRALQAGTSHFLGQNFARSSDIRFINRDGVEEYGWTVSWGMSTRLIGGLIMTHSDDNGLVIPPKMSSIHVVILPIFNDLNKSTVLGYCNLISSSLKELHYNDETISVEVDLRDLRGGEKYWNWVKKGVPLIIEIGMRDIEKNNICFTRRDDLNLLKTHTDKQEFIDGCRQLLTDIQNNLFKRAQDYRDNNTFDIDSKKEFYDFFEDDGAGFVRTYWTGDTEIEQSIKKDLGVTLRCIPLNQHDDVGVCPFTGKFSKQHVIWSRSY